MTKEQKMYGYATKVMGLNMDEETFSKFIKRSKINTLIGLDRFLSTNEGFTGEGQEEEAQKEVVKNPQKEMGKKLRSARDSYPLKLGQRALGMKIGFPSDSAQRTIDQLERGKMVFTSDIINKVKGVFPNF